MNNSFKVFMVFVLSFGILTLAMNDAEARRFGGGRSFGGKSAFSSPFKRSATAPRSASQQAAFTKNNAMRQQLSQRGGIMGMLGALALGGVLGALFFGGAFENINFFDILIFAAIAFILFKLLAGRRPQPQPAGNFGAAARLRDEELDARAHVERRGFETDLMFDRDKVPPGGGHELTPAGFRAAGEADFDEPTERSAGPRPPGFKEKDFLAGAKRAFEMLQAAWNTGDLSEIRGLTTDEMFAQVQDQFREAGTDNYVELVKVEAELIDVRELDGTQEATVMFDAMLRESRDERPAQVREVWHFTRSARSREPKWFLDGIQQIED